MVHGNPTGAFLYHEVIESMRGAARCLAPDLLGFGLSDKPNAESYYSLDLHVAILEEFVRALGLKDIVLVVHGWGGPIGLAAALRDPNRYTHLVILNGPTEPTWKMPLRYRLPFLFAGSNVLRSVVVRRLGLFQLLGFRKMREEYRTTFLRANHDFATRAALAAFLGMIPYHRWHPNRPELRRIFEEVESWDIPALVLFSDSDSEFFPKAGEEFSAKLVNGLFHAVHGARHYLQSQAPEQIACEILRFARPYTEKPDGRTRLLQKAF